MSVHIEIATQAHFGPYGKISCPQCSECQLAPAGPNISMEATCGTPGRAKLAAMNSRRRSSFPRRRKRRTYGAAD